eukprot:m.201845 g.201845  ORF g.201845 m.201845 type:complete len:63 (-) comp10683_c0_seq14:898-1086(-)
MSLQFQSSRLLPRNAPADTREHHQAWKSVCKQHGRTTSEGVANFGMNSVNHLAHALVKKDLL